MYTNTILSEADVKVFCDNEGNKLEVLLSYETYQEMLEFIERYAYFYKQEVQERLQRASEDLTAGRYLEVDADNIETALEWLHE